jgi:hypothetical protein
MPVITITVDTPLPTQTVLESAYDFTARRADVFPAVEPAHFEVHDIGSQTADVTEGTGTGIGMNWERCDYDWSTPGSVTATVTDSNVYAPGSSWRLSVVPTQEGSRVEMSWVRRFKHSPRGVLFGVAFRVIGRAMFRNYAKQIVDNLESLEASDRSA